MSSAQPTPEEWRPFKKAPTRKKAVGRKPGHIPEKNEIKWRNQRKKSKTKKLRRKKNGQSQLLLLTDTDESDNGSSVQLWDASVDDIDDFIEDPSLTSELNIGSVMLDKFASEKTVKYL